MTDPSPLPASTRGGTCARHSVVLSVSQPGIREQGTAAMATLIHTPHVIVPHTRCRCHRPCVRTPRVSSGSPRIAGESRLATPHVAIVRPTSARDWFRGDRELRCLARMLKVVTMDEYKVPHSRRHIHTVVCPSTHHSHSPFSLSLSIARALDSRVHTHMATQHWPLPHGGEGPFCGACAADAPATHSHWLNGLEKKKTPCAWAAWFTTGNYIIHPRLVRAFLFGQQCQQWMDVPRGTRSGALCMYCTLGGPVLTSVSWRSRAGSDAAHVPDRNCKAAGNGALLFEKICLPRAQTPHGRYDLVSACSPRQKMRGNATRMLYAGDSTLSEPTHRCA